MIQNIFKKRKKRTIIIGIHGLSNKPHKRLLKQWWRKSIEEGLINIKSPKIKFDFRMVYWADILYEKPLNPKIKDSENPLYLDEPYITSHSLQTDQEKTFWQRTKNFGQYLKELIFLGKFGLNNFRRPFDYIISQGFRDLDVYYNEGLEKDEMMESEPIKIQIRKRLSKTIRKHKNKNILILSHSMGSIITYDVLYQLQEEVTIDTLVTLGSPLGLPLIRENVIKEHQMNHDDNFQPPTPNNLEHWYNFSDKEDNIAAFNKLSDNYKPNNKGVKPIGKLVYNDYKLFHTENAHKSYGYLRTKEVATLISSFLSEGRSSILVKGKNLLRKKDKKSHSK